MNIVIVGQGAIGLLWYHHFSKLQSSLKESSTLKAIDDSRKNAKGNTKESADTHQIHLSLLASTQQQKTIDTYLFTDHERQQTASYQLHYTQPSDIKNADVVLVCLKAYQVKTALLDLAHLITKHTLIILAHNGMGTIEALPKSFKQTHTILAMLTTHGCLRTKPLSIQHTGMGQSEMGLLTGNVSIKTKTQLISLFNKALPTVTFHENIAEKQWTKLAINCVINPLTAIDDASNGEIALEKYHSLIHNILQEVVLVAEQEKVPLEQQTLFNIVITVANATAKNSSSMRCDVQQNRQTEVDYINGFIHQLGVKHHIATPVNDILWQKVKDKPFIKK